MEEAKHVPRVGVILPRKQKRRRPGGGGRRRKDLAGHLSGGAMRPSGLPKRQPGGGGGRFVAMPREEMRHRMGFKVAVPGGGWHRHFVRDAITREEDARCVLTGHASRGGAASPVRLAFGAVGGLESNGMDHRAAQTQIGQIAVAQAGQLAQRCAVHLALGRCCGQISAECCEAVCQVCTKAVCLDCVCHVLFFLISMRAGPMPLRLAD